jgi:hypothetical protein
MAGQMASEHLQIAHCIWNLPTVVRNAHAGWSRGPQLALPASVLRPRRRAVRLRLNIDESSDVRFDPTFAFLRLSRSAVACTTTEWAVGGRERA